MATTPPMMMVALFQHYLSTDSGNNHDDDDGPSSWILPMLLLLVGCMVMLATLLICHRPFFMERLPKRSEALEILEQASRGTSGLWFPRRTTLAAFFSSWVPPKKVAGEDDRRDGLLETLLQCIQWNTTNHRHPQKQCHQERLQVLGGALHCRQKGYGDEGCRTVEALSGLLEALHPATTPILKEKIKELSTTDTSQDSCSGLPFMDDVIEWALLPNDRAAMRTCLQGLSICAPAISELTKEATKSKTIARPLGWPEEVWTILIQEILQSQETEQGTMSTDPSPQGMSATKKDQDTNSYSETAPLLIHENESSTTHKRHDATLELRTTQMMEYLYSLNVLVRKSATGDEKNGENDTLQHDKLCNTLAELRPGVLRPPPKTTTIASASTVNNHPAWITPFLQRLEDATFVLSKDKGLLLPTFALQQLPTLMIRLGRTANATDLLHHNVSLARARLQHFQLYTVMDCYTCEWAELSMPEEGDGTILANKGSPRPSTVFLWLGEQCLSQGSQLTTTLLTPSSNYEDGDHKEKQQHDRRDLAAACYRLAHSALAYGTATKRHHQDEFHLFPRREISGLLHLARHLQVLVLEGQSHRVANAIYNLALTLHVRESFPKETGQDGRSVNCRRGLRRVAAKTPLTLSQKCFRISSSLTAVLDKLRRQDGRYQKSCAEPLTLEGIAKYLREALEKLVPELQAIVAQAKLVTKTTATTPKDGGNPSRSSLQDGAQFRIGQVVRHLKTATEEWQMFADIQVALCDFPSSDDTGTSN